MRPSLSWSDLAGARVGVWVLGVEGIASVGRLAAMGVTPVLADDSPPSAEVSGLPVLATAAGGLDALRGCDVVIKAPGISRYRADARSLAADGVSLVGGLGLWLAEAPRDRVACVTGTKGKSSTVSVAGHLLSSLGYKCLVGGNIGRPPYDVQYLGVDFDYWIIETSSYQATDLAFSPPVVAVTSLHPDHLPWHEGVENYYRDKLSVCSQPGCDLTIANGDSDILRALRQLMGPRVEWVHADDDPRTTWMEPLGLLGTHNRRNALIARACLRALGVPEAADTAALRRAAAGFQGLESRLQNLGRVDDVMFVDDSLSTNVLPTLAALDSFPGRGIALIVGGQDRGIDYGPLAAGIAGRAAPTLVLTLPENGPRIRAAIEAAAAGRVEVRDCAGLEAAVRAGYQWSRGRDGGMVLLSPAAPSFGAFRSYRHRSEVYQAAVRALGELRPPAAR
jgi:UDP-N-acetylmuramoyl-L-alanine---L-glutamate ligase